MGLKGGKKKKEKEEEKIPHICESKSHRPLRGRCPKTEGEEEDKRRKGISCRGNKQVQQGGWTGALLHKIHIHNTVTHEIAKNTI